MSQKILTDYDEKAAERLARTMLLSPQGRDWCRYFLVEKGKQDPDFAQLKREMFDILSDIINALYTETAPVITGAQR
jgi:hypothetical protein